MSFIFPRPTQVGQSVRHRDRVFVWDGVGWHVDRNASGLQLSLAPAASNILVYPLAAGATTIDLKTLDRFGKTFAFSTEFPEGVSLYLGGTRIVEDDGQGLGDYTVNRDTSVITLAAPVAAATTAQVQILLPPGRMPQGAVKIYDLLDFDTDWSSALVPKPTGLQDGVNKVFDVYVDRGAGPEPMAPGSARELVIHLDGVQQRSGVDYTVTGSTLTMTDAPPADAAFWGQRWEPSTKDGGAFSLDEALNTFVELVGDTMTGPLQITHAKPLVLTQTATVNRWRVDTGVGTRLGLQTEDAAGALEADRYHFERDGALPGPLSVVTRGTGDARYLQLTGGTLSGQLMSSSGGSETAPAISHASHPTTGWYFHPVGGKTLPAITYNGTLAAIFEPHGAVPFYTQTVITLQKGDTRYLQLTGGALSGNLEARGGSVVVQSPTATDNANFSMRNSAGTPAGLLYAAGDHAHVVLRKFDSLGTTITAEIAMVDRDIRLYALGASVAPESIITQGRGDARYLIRSGGTMTGQIRSSSGGSATVPVIGHETFPSTGFFFEPVEGKTLPSVTYEGAISAVFEPTGTGASYWNSVITLQKGDARYLTLANTPAEVRKNIPGHRNVIINGDFDIWQRGTSFTSGGTYTADRWYVPSNVTQTTSRLTFPPGYPPVPGSTWYLRVDRTTASTAANHAIVQKVESVRTLAGRTVTLSFLARLPAGKELQALAYQQFGTGGTPSATVTHTIGNFVGTGAFEKYTLTTTLPNIEGKTLGTDGNDNLMLGFNEQHTFGLFTFDLAQVQLEDGPAATPFERLGFAKELSACQRYHQVLDLELRFTAPDTGDFFQKHLYPQRMRAAPTVNLTTPTATNATTFVALIEHDDLRWVVRPGVSGGVHARSVIYLDAEL